MGVVYTLRSGDSGVPSINDLAGPSFSRQCTTQFKKILSQLNTITVRPQMNTITRHKMCGIENLCTVTNLT